MTGTFENIALGKRGFFWRALIQPIIAYDGKFLPIKSAKIKDIKYLLQFVDSQIAASPFYCSILGNNIVEDITEVEYISDEVE